MLSSSPLLAAFMLAQAADTLSIRFIGNAAFALSDGETTLVTDFPYRSGAFGYMAYDLAASGPTGPVVSVITHRHDDHFAPALFAQRGWRLIAPPEVQGRVPADRRLTIGGPVVVGAFTIIPHDTPHSDVQHWSYEILWWIDVSTLPVTRKILHTSQASVTWTWCLSRRGCCAQPWMTGIGLPRTGWSCITSLPATGIVSVVRR